MNLDSFLRKITYQEITTDGLRGIGNVIETMAGAEGLDAHKNAVTIRLKSLGKRRREKRPAGRDRLRKRLPKYSSEKQDKDTNDGYPGTTQRKHTHAGPLLDRAGRIPGANWASTSTPTKTRTTTTTTATRPASEKPETEAGGNQGRAGRKDLHRQRSGRTDRPGVPVVLRTPAAQCGVDRPDLRHVQGGGGDQRRADARGAVEPGFTLDAEKLLAATDENTRLLFLCSPNNPSGNCFPKKRSKRSSAVSTAS